MLRNRRLLASVVAIFILLGGAASAEFAYRSRSARAPTPSGQVQYYRHSRFERALVRDMDYRGSIHINRFGFRGPDFDLVKSPGTARIMVVGAGTTFDPCARNDAETWVARLEYWLHQLAPDRRFQVINAGVSGFPMLGQVIRLQTELYKFSPDLVVVYAGHGIVTSRDFDARREDGSQTPNAAKVLTPWANWLSKHSRLYGRLRPNSHQVPTHDLNDEERAQAVANAASNFKHQLTSFTLIARSIGARVAFVEMNRVTGQRPPSEFTAAERATWTGLFSTDPETVHAGYLRFKTVWQTVADSAGAVFIPEDKISITGAENYCTRDPIHFNKAGAEALGQRLAKQLIAAGVVN